VIIRRSVVAVDGDRNDLEASANNLGAFTRFSRNSDTDSTNGIRAAVGFRRQNGGVGGSATRRDTGGFGEIVDFVDGQEFDALTVRGRMGGNRNTRGISAVVTDVTINADGERSAGRFRFAQTTSADLIGTRTWVFLVTSGTTRRDDSTLTIRTGLTGWAAGIVFWVARFSSGRLAETSRGTFKVVSANFRSRTRTAGITTGVTLIRIGRSGSTGLRSGVALITIGTIGIAIFAAVAILGTETSANLHIGTTITAKAR